MSSESYVCRSELPPHTHTRPFSPEKAYLALMASGPTDAEAVTALFDQLKAVPPSFSFLGEWVGGHFPTLGHPVSDAVTGIKWAGKRFLSEDDVEPLVVYDEQGKRVPWVEWGRARLRRVEFHGVVSAAVIYDDRPIIDYFRYVDEDTVAGMMDPKNPEVAPWFHFYIKRCKPDM
ncbi:hypothetical protein FB45DRAFT_1129157 [Roridomyces roridus]|uniref:Uncharacterized protein n=1 Tax=Roridomyces roridus TaxID=1738132 RepID=A0AAD7FAM5_9AGAR|nr:hypothetical protein FB45DRAFT_1129157 [Roridomyces roridus]